jgi:serpin B
MRARWGLVIFTLLAGFGAATHEAQALSAPITAHATCSLSLPQGAGATGKLVADGNAFAFRLYAAIARNDNSSNVFLSPASVELALDMAYDGAAGSTAQGMAEALGLGGMNAASVRQQASALLAALQANADPKAQLTIANSLWARTGTRLRAAFTDDAARDFAAHVTHLDFSSPAALAAINGWVSCATRGTIPTILRSIPPDVMLYLLNAVYFSGKWSAPFKTQDTHPRPFTTGTGQQVQVPTMDRIGTYAYDAGTNAQVVALPYGSGRFQMIVLVPTHNISLRGFRSQLRPAAWQAWISSLRPMQGEVALPRFSVANTFRLNGVLAALGMSQSFSNGADFSGMCVQRCKLTEVRHKTFLKVYEAGTTASAATSVGVAPVAVPRANFHLLVNRPFFLAIRDSETGAILFWGGINDPSKA